MARAKSKITPLRAALVMTTVVIVAIGLVLFLLRPWAADEVRQDASFEGVITVSGTTLCLPHRDTSGPQTLECAIGLKDAEGRHYALSDTDPTYKNTGSIPMNTQVVVTGTLKTVPDEKYATVGTIAVTSVTLSAN